MSLWPWFCAKFGTSSKISCWSPVDGPDLTVRRQRCCWCCGKLPHYHSVTGSEPVSQKQLVAPTTCPRTVPRSSLTSQWLVVQLFPTLALAQVLVDRPPPVSWPGPGASPTLPCTNCSISLCFFWTLNLLHANFILLDLFSFNMQKCDLFALSFSSLG